MSMKGHNSNQLLRKFTLFWLLRTSCLLLTDATQHEYESSTFISSNTTQKISLS